MPRSFSMLPKRRCAHRRRAGPASTASPTPPRRIAPGASPSRGMFSRTTRRSPSLLPEPTEKSLFMSEAPPLSANLSPTPALSAPVRGYAGLHQAVPTLSPSFFKRVRAAARAQADDPWRGQYAAPAAVLAWIERHPEFGKPALTPVHPETAASANAPATPPSSAGGKSGSRAVNYAPPASSRRSRARRRLLAGLPPSP